jgi:putative spermidine/putrescine transport system ATP-binding protein
MGALTFAGIRKTFGTNVALENLDLDVHDGELISLLGPSGCGKTTALRIAAGFEPADTGTVSVSGSDITNVPAHKRNMGMVFQSYSLFPNLSVTQNVDYGLRTRKVDKAERKRRVAETLELVELGRFAGRYPHQLSGGQQQRVALARALAVRPQVLLLDEPLSALDAKVRAILRDEIRRIQTEVGITTLFVTHDQEEALGISDRIGVMSNGRLEQLATPREVYRHPASAFVARFVGSMNELPGTVLGPDAIGVGDLVLPTAAGASLSNGDEVLVLVRPEDVTAHLSATSEGQTGLPGTVTAITFQGPTTVIAVRLDRFDKLVSSEMNTSIAPIVNPGDRVGITIDATRAVAERAPISLQPVV